jgi:hypothetical protein
MIKSVDRTALVAGPGDFVMHYVKVTRNAIAATFPAQSMTMFVVPR